MHVFHQHMCDKNKSGVPSHCRLDVREYELRFPHHICMDKEASPAGPMWCKIEGFLGQMLWTNENKEASSTESDSPK